MSETKEIKKRKRGDEGYILDKDKLIDRLENPYETAVENANRRPYSKKMTSTRHRIVFWMVACGATYKETAKATKYSEDCIKQLMRKPESKAEVERLQDRIFGREAKKKFAQVFPEAFKVARQVMLSNKTKPGIRAAQARDFMDRHAGKPLQRTENETTIISELIMRLDERGTRQIDVAQGNNDIIDVVPQTAELPKPQEVQKEEIDIDSWVADNLGEK